MKFIVTCLRAAAGALALAASVAALAQPVAGRDYRLISPPQPTDSGKRVEVLEFFYYGCPHCSSLQAPLHAWLKQKPADVEFRRMPAVFSDAWLPLTQAYYAFDALGVLEKVHYDMFTAIHEQKVRLMDPAVLFDWVAKRGIDRKKFIDTYNSFGVKNRAQRSIEVTGNYGIPGTPALTVDGKYLVSPSMILKPDRTVDYERYFQVLDQMIARARRERAQK